MINRFQQIGSKLYESYLQLFAEGFRDNLPPSIPEKKRRGKKNQSTALNLLDRLDEHQDEILRFLHDPLFLFNNNEAERDIIMTKLKMKISGVLRRIVELILLAGFEVTSQR
jgi:transposase